jgi:hypothetical protein
LRSASSFAYWNTNTAITPNAPTTHNAFLDHLPDARSADAAEANATGADDRVVIATP